MFQSLGFYNDNRTDANITSEDKEKLLSTAVNDELPQSTIPVQNDLVTISQSSFDSPLNDVVFDTPSIGSGGVFDFKSCDHRVLIYTTCYNVIDG